MSEEEFASLIAEALFAKYEQDSDEEPPIASIRTFEEALLLTRNKGLVITMEDGSKYQVSVVRE